MIENNKQIKIIFPKIFSVGQMGNFGSVVVQNYANLYLKICCKNVFANFLA